MACDANPGLQKKLTEEFITEASTEDSGGCSGKGLKVKRIPKQRSKGP